MYWPFNPYLHAGLGIQIWNKFLGPIPKLSNTLNHAELVCFR